VKQASDIRKIVTQYAEQAGFELSGIVAVPREGLRELDYFPPWIEQGRAGEMEYLKSRNENGELKRAAIGNVAPWAKSVIVCAINYNTDQPYSTEIRERERGWISRYAWFKSTDGKATDYHDAILARLRRVEAMLQEHSAELSDGPLQTRCYVDTGPLVERVYAKYAGIGWLGKNTCMINQDYGSWLFLGTILTSIDLQQEDTAVMAAPPDRCGSCTRCIDACPTDAFIAPYQMDATRCISYLTIEKRGEIPIEFRDKMGSNVFGCDICQDVCPWNGHAQTNAAATGKTPRQMPLATAEEFQPGHELVAPPLERLAKMSRENFNAEFRGSPIKRAKYQGFRRNVAVAMGNSRDPSFRPLLEEMANDEDTRVAEHARWALQNLNSHKPT
jgi:epoxyqueuosine reductase